MRVSGVFGSVVVFFCDRDRELQPPPRRCNRKFIRSANEKSWCDDLETPESTCHENEGKERPERPFMEMNTEEGGYPERERRK